MEAAQYICENCGGQMTFDISSQTMQCSHCGTVFRGQAAGQVVEHDFELLHNGAAAWSDEVTTLRCEGCGSELVVEPHATVANCTYCGSSRVLVARQKAGLPPDAIVPFRLDRSSAVEAFRGWLRRRFFAPGTLRGLRQEDSFSAQYLPYWTFDANADAHYTAMGGRVTYRKRGDKQEREVKWFPVSGQINHFFDDVLVSARTPDELYAAIEKRIEPYNTQDSRVFDPSYLSGFRAEKYSMSPQDAYPSAQRKMENALEEMARQQVLRQYDEVSQMRLSARFWDRRFKHILLPAWFAGYMFMGKWYPVVINGQSGRVFGKYPLSKIKVGAAIFFGAVIFALLAWLLYNYGG